jgi:MGT family glycosyltransferase
VLAGWGDEPLVYMALGTMFTMRREVFAAVLEALAELPVRVLVSTWGRFSAEDLAPVPGNARIAAQVNSRAVLREARLHISHGGASSVHESLVEGVPLLCLPQAADQALWAGAVQATGAAEILEDESPAAIRSAAERLLAEGAIRRRVEEIQRSLADYDGAQVAADAVAELL